jgi:hypothetical protein
MWPTRVLVHSVLFGPFWWFPTTLFCGSCWCVYAFGCFLLVGRWFSFFVPHFPLSNGCLFFFYVWQGLIVIAKLSIPHTINSMSLDVVLHFYLHGFLIYFLMFKLKICIFYYILNGLLFLFYFTMLCKTIFFLTIHYARQQHWKHNVKVQIIALWGFSNFHPNKHRMNLKCHQKKKSLQIECMWNTMIMPIWLFKTIFVTILWII